MTARGRRTLFRHPATHGIEPTRAVAAVAVLATLAALTGCGGSQPAPEPTATSATVSPAPTQTPAAGPGGYDSLSQACTAIADDLITLQTIAGTVEVGIGDEGADAILDELAQMRELAPVVLRAAYRSIEDAVRDLPTTDDQASPSPTRSPLSTPSPSPTASPGPEKTAPVRVVIDSASDTLTVWLTRNCEDL